MAQLLRGLRLPRLLALAVAFGIYYGGTQQAVHGVLSHDRWNWAEMAVAGGIWGVLWLPASLLGAALGRRSVDRGWVPKSPARQREDRYEHLIGPALGTGTLPSDADPGVWGPALHDRARDSTIVRWVLTVLLIGCAGLIGTAAVVANDNAWGVWAVAVLVSLEGVVAFRLLGRRVHAIDRLRRQLH